MITLTGPADQHTSVRDRLAQHLLGQMLLIRRFEERVLQLFDEGSLFGTTHCYIGQEANAVGILNHLNRDDVVWSNHRCHGHYLTFTGDVEGLMAELMGKATGVIGGRGGSQHLCGANFFSNGIQGGIVAAAAGMAFAEKYKGTNQMVTVFLGDGTLGEGIVYEAFNLASLWRLPLLFVIENNRYAQSTPVEQQLAGSMAARPAAFGIDTVELASFNALEIYERAGEAVALVRALQRPRALVLHTYRLCHHSKSDDYRDPKEVEQWKRHDPIDILRPLITPERFAELDEIARGRVRSAEANARQAPFPILEPHDLDESIAL